MLRLYRQRFRTAQRRRITDLAFTTIFMKLTRTTLIAIGVVAGAAIVLLIISSAQADTLHTATQVHSALTSNS